MIDSNRYVRKRFGVCVDGFPFILIGAALSLAAGIFWGTWGVAPLVIISLWMIWFFRDPERIAPTDSALIVSPADGKIIDIRRCAYPRLLTGEATRISIFMNVFNVHVNRIPFSGTIRQLSYNKGRFRVASHDKASLDNEQMAIVLETISGAPIFFVQIAGLVARRIVCRVKEGDTVERGERFGLIRFGSRCDVYVSDSVDVSAKVGDIAKAGETILGRFK